VREVGASPRPAVGALPRCGPKWGSRRPVQRECGRAQKWAYDLHTEIKHRILIQYLNPWLTILGSSYNSLAYVDGFAGRGRYVSGEAGSPLLVLDALVARLNTHLQEEFVCRFVEAHPENYANLEAEIARHPVSRYSRITCKLYPSTFSAASSEIMADIRQRRQPSFFFVDPFGYDDPSMATLQEVLELPRAEVLVNLMFNFAHRAMNIQGNSKLTQILDSLFGSHEWINLIPLVGQERERAFMELYRNQLRRSGAKHVVRFRMGDDQIARTLYYLIHGTKHSKGGMLMKDVMVALASPGQRGYGGATRHISMPLFDLQQRDLPKFLHSRYAGRTITFDDLIIDTLEDEETATSQEKDYRAAIRELERNGAVTIQQITTTYGLDGEDEITFALHRQSNLF